MSERRSRWSAEFALRGAEGEPVDLRRTIASHGLVELPPMFVEDDGRTLEVTFRVGEGRPRTVRISAGRPGHGVVEVKGRRPGERQADAILAGVRHILRLDQDLSGFYGAAAEDPHLSWACSGAGRMVRSPTVFEEVVKTICTTNCAWSATERMVGALVAHLGDPAAGAPAQGGRGRAFPTPEAMAGAGEDFYRDVVRAGYRGAYLRTLGSDVAAGALDLEVLGRATPEDMTDDEIAERLLALPGVGPYAAAHIMMLLGRCSRLVLDSWTRPTYSRLSGGRPVKDATIERRFRRYGDQAGLAFWLFLTRGWVSDEEQEPEPA
jgi:3-methyladenine DNA glycosylase/8-oxoguanine DNA glycosylase